MDAILAMLVTVIGLCIFETISSIDNAIINAQVLSTMGAKMRRWFLVWGLLLAVFVVRGILPWLIVWLASPGFGPIEALTATFSSDESVKAAMERSTPILLSGGGVFLVLLFLHWLFLEDKEFGIIGEKFFYDRGIWFYAVASVFLCVVIWESLKLADPMVAFSAAVGSSAFFITHGFRANAEESERRMLEDRGMSDMSKVLFLQVIDATFSIDGVIGAFAFTRSVPLILLGNGLGALVVRQLTVSNIDRIRRYRYLQNGAMYSILFLGAVMIAESFGAHIPFYVSPILTIGSVAFFFWKSCRHLRETE